MSARNTPTDLSFILFEALERVNELEVGDEGFAQEIARARALTSLASQIVANNQTALRALQLKDDAVSADLVIPAMLIGEGDGR